MRILLLLALSVSAHAAAIFTTPAGSTVTDGPVNATATFTLLTPTQLQIVLTDNLANPTSVGQLPSDLLFTITGISGLSLASMSSTAITINSNNTSTPGGSITSGWAEGTSGGGFLLCVICAPGFPATAGPAQLIIGPGPYTNANGSIAGNGPHNPFLNQTATFTLNVSGLTSSATLGNVVFSFGTQFGSNVTGTLTGGTPQLTAVVPEPGSASLAAVAFGILAGVARLRRRRAFNAGLR